MTKGIIAFLLLLPVLCLQGQLVKPYTLEEQKAYAVSMEKHLNVLAADSLEGREAGTPSEMKAAEYIVSCFKSLELKPIPGKDYLLPFPFSEGCSYANGSIEFGTSIYELNTHFFYLNNLIGYELKGQLHFVGSGMKLEDYAGTDTTSNPNLVFLIDVNYSDTCRKMDNCQAYFDLVQSAVLLATSRRPAAVVLVSSDNKKYPVYSDWKVRAMPPTVPVIGAGAKLSETLLANRTDTLYSHCSFAPNTRTGYNVAAFIDNNQPKTIVLGAHYDHLGYGGFNSRYNGPAAIHNGADDNASGTALLIELARRIKKLGYTDHNYLFVAFDAEEKGLLGSKAFLSQNNFDASNMMAMLNFDMVGRADPLIPRINIIGTGTATQWDSLITATGPEQIGINRSKSGLGGSDQMSFYLKKVPVLFFITGMHKDYHQPSDDIDKINFQGMVSVLYLAENMLVALNGVDSLHFEETESQDNGGRKRPGVTLGLIPDHAWSGKGLRIDGITQGKTADKAGLLAGDIIIQIDDKEITDILSYMNALSAYKKGDVAKITYLRGEIQTTVEVTF